MTDFNIQWLCRLAYYNGNDVLLLIESFYFYFNYIAERFRIIICVSSVDFYYFLLFYLCNNGIYVIFRLVLLLLFIVGGLGIFGIKGLAVTLLLLL